jgi:uncharacterized protein (TIGR02231 family)
MTLSMHTTFKLTRLAALACLFSTAAAQAQPSAAADSRITQVTLYPGSATVERVARVAAGAKKLTFACLPASVDVQSLAVVADASVRVGELAVLTEARDAVPACATSPLDARIRELEDKKAALTNENNALALVNSYLKGVAAPTSTATATAPGSPSNIGATAEALRRSSQETGTRQNQIARQQEELDRALKPLLAERTRSQAGRARVVTVGVTLDAPRDAEVRLSYQVRGPGWTPTYRALLNTRTNSLRLERQALVAQSSGEDWSGVRMKLSTGQPRQGTTGPTPRPWRIGIAPPPQPLEEMADNRSMKMMAPAPAAAVAMRELPEVAQPSFDVSVFENSFATEFNVPQNIDLPSNGQRVTLALGSIDTTPQLFTRTSPLADASAWLVAVVPQPAGVWPTGPLQLYRDGAFVGSDTLRTGNARPWNLSFGRDELVLVQVEPQKDLQATTGFVGTQALRSTARAYRVANRHTTPVALQVLEASPVAVDAKVSVKAKFSPQPSTQSWNDQPGVVLWSSTLDAGQTARFTTEYEVAYPKDAQLQESQ